jgi:hypothetical protein
MANKISRCNICGEFLNSKRELKRHKDKNHRIAPPKRIAEITKTAGTSFPTRKSTGWSENDEGK